jgi:hypothetical protein
MPKTSQLKDPHGEMLHFNINDAWMVCHLHDGLLHRIDGAIVRSSRRG